MLPSFSYQRSIGFNIVPIPHRHEDAQCPQKQDMNASSTTKLPFSFSFFFWLSRAKKECVDPN